MRKLAFALLLASSCAWTGCPEKSKSAPLTLPDGRRLSVELVDTPDARTKGLMFRTALPEDYGMLFVFAREMPLTFWMKNTLVPLDMVFIGSDRTITRIHRAVKASTLDTPEDRIARAGGVGQFVLELPAGAAERYRLTEGQRLGFEVAIPDL